MAIISERAANFEVKNCGRQEHHERHVHIAVIKREVKVVHGYLASRGLVGQEFVYFFRTYPLSPRSTSMTTLVIKNVPRKFSVCTCLVFSSLVCRYICHSLVSSF